MANLFQFDKKRIAGTTPGVVGIDEAGRGCFAGPVVAGAVWTLRSFYENPTPVKRGKFINDSKQLSEGDWLVLLDEKGREMRSMEFADWMQKRMNSGVKRLCFVIGGPYGFSKAVYDRANESLSLSRMTFSHQIVRVLFAEQLYRAFTIIRNEPYHHE